VKIAGRYGSCFWTTTIAVWNTWRFSSDAIVNSPSTTAIDRRDAASSPERRFGASTRTTIAVQPAPRDRAASASVRRSTASIEAWIAR
jgi:hypothetical protein